MSDDGLGLDMPQDESTRLSLRSALFAEAKTSLFSLTGRRLEATDFDAIVIGAPPGTFLPGSGIRSRFAETRARNERVVKILCCVLLVRRCGQGEF